MKFIFLSFALGIFTFLFSPSKKYEIVDSAEQAQLFEEIESQLEVVDEVISLELQQDNEGAYYYDLKGNKAGEAVSFTVAINSSAGGCTCANDGAVAPSSHFFWVCIVPCL